MACHSSHSLGARQKTSACSREDWILRISEVVYGKENRPFGVTSKRRIRGEVTSESAIKRINHGRAPAKLLRKLTVVSPKANPRATGNKTCRCHAGTPLRSGIPSLRQKHGGASQSIQAAFGLPDSSICREVSGLFSAFVLSAGMLARTFPVSLILAIQSASHFANSVFLAPALTLPWFCRRLNIGAVRTSWMRINLRCAETSASRYGDSL